MRESVKAKVEYYVDKRGRRPFTDWVDSLDPSAVDVVLFAVNKRMGGNTGNSKPIGGGVHELKAKGFRIYYGIHGDKLIILLAGGTKEASTGRYQRRKIQMAGFQAGTRKQVNAL